MTSPIVIGVDEAGRGALAGPVVAAAVILPKRFDRTLVNDSKQLTLKQREERYIYIQKKASFIGIATIEPEEIDRINILRASLKAMAICISKYKKSPTHIKIDGNKNPYDYGQPLHFDPRPIIETIIKGDQKIAEISAASIIAKVTRDHIMDIYHKTYPHYQFHIHKGYGTALHYDMLFKHGPACIHRKSFNLSKQTTLF